MDRNKNMDNRPEQNEIFSEVVRAGKRTYFFDVKETKGGEPYLNITESIRKFNEDDGKFFYQKHRIFLYKEDFEKFAGGLAKAIKHANENLAYEDELEDVVEDIVEDDLSETI